MRHALHQIRRVGSERGAHHFRVGAARSSTARRPRASARDRTGRASSRLVVDALGLAGEVLGPARGEEISLLPEIEELGIRPVRVLEAIVAWLWLDHRLHVLFAEKAAHRAPPKLGVVLEELVLRRGELAGLAHPLSGDLTERLGRLAGFRRHAVGTGAVAGARPECRAPWCPDRTDAPCSGRARPTGRLGSLPTPGPACTSLFFSCMKGRALILPPVNRNDAKVTEHLSDLDDSRS